MNHALLPLLIVLSLSASAQEISVVSAPDSRPMAPVLFRDAAPAQPLLTNSHAWQGLNQLSDAEAANAGIDIELPSYAPANAALLAAEIAELWNTGRRTDALVKYAALGDAVDPSTIAVALSWRTPVASRISKVGGSEVRVGATDSIVTCALEIDSVSRHLFAVVQYHVGGSYRWALNLSTNAGTTWVETLSWGSTSVLMSVGAAVAAGNVYITYTPNTTTVRMRKQSAVTGASANFADGQTYHDIYTTISPENVREQVLASNQEDRGYNNRLYCGMITTTGKLKVSWNIPDAALWTAYGGNVTNATRGLAIAWDSAAPGGNFPYLWISYVDNASRANVSGVTNVVDTIKNYVAHAGLVQAGEYTAIGAHRDTVLCAFEGTVADGAVMYVISYANTANWYYGYASDTLARAECPSLTLDCAGGMVVTHRYYTSTRQARFVYRRYGQGNTWTAPKSFAAIEPYYIPAPVVCLGSGVYGFLYVTWYTPFQQAYFTTYDITTGVSQPPPGAPRGFVLYQNFPNPFNPTTEIRYVIPTQTHVSLKVFNTLGQEVRTLVDRIEAPGQKSVTFDAQNLSSGVYLCRLEAGSFASTVKMAVVK